MMNIWHDIDDDRIYPTDFVSVIEISKGSNMKYELDKKTGMLALDRVLFTATYYPMNYGFIPRTYGDDNDPLDVLLLCSQPIQPMTYTDIKELPKHIFEEVKHFFSVYKQLESKSTTVRDIGGPVGAVAVIERAIENYKAHFCTADNQ